jgi:hypothetical protein
MEGEADPKAIKKSKSEPKPQNLNKKQQNVPVETSLSIWEDTFFNRSCKIINPPDARLESVKQNNNPVQFYCLMIGLLDGISRRIVGILRLIK